MRPKAFCLTWFALPEVSCVFHQSAPCLSCITLRMRSRIEFSSTYSTGKIAAISFASVSFADGKRGFVDLNSPGKRITRSVVAFPRAAALGTGADDGAACCISKRTRARSSASRNLSTGTPCSYASTQTASGVLISVSFFFLCTFADNVCWLQPVLAAKAARTFGLVAIYSLLRNHRRVLRGIHVRNCIRFRSTRRLVACLALHRLGAFFWRGLLEARETNSDGVLR